MTPDLTEKLHSLAATPILLVACDYDGTLAALVAHRDRALPSERSLAALELLNSAPWTATAVISGRSLVELRSFLAHVHPRIVVGSHGAEWLMPGVALAPEERSLLREVENISIDVASRGIGLDTEVKPAGVALHFRAAPPEVAAPLVAEAIERCTQLPGVRMRHGSKVVEFMVVGANKGEALLRAAFTTGATGALFIGDDVTDEDVFRSMRPQDVGIKVGEGETAANLRVPGIDDVTAVLETVAHMRRQWAQSRRLVPLEKCAILSDQRTAAVVSPGAKISWLCLPRFDSSAIFAELVGGDTAGYFDVAPTDGTPQLRSSYDGDSFVLVTEWANVRVTDYLDCSAGRAFQKAGRADLVRVIEGSAPVRVRFAPRLDFGRVATQLRLRDGGLEVEGSNDPVALWSPGVVWELRSVGEHQTAEAVVDPSSGPIVMELRYGSANLKPAPPEPERRSQIRDFWSGWARSLRLPGAHADLVRRSALVLKALCYGPTGVITAAATTSLPEQVGGTRNWDYRYCWPRDGAMAAGALLALGNTGHALKFLDWMLEVVDRCQAPERLHPIYTVSGTHLPPEAELGHLAGFGQSRPVRIGNAAANQVQLDVFGPIVHLVALLAERGAPIAPDHWRLVRAMVRAVEARWMEPDHGIWEMRLDRRHHVHSKVMCWHTIDRALVVEDAVHGTRNADWAALRDTIRADVLEHGWNPRTNAFTGAYGHTYADASVLAIGLTGLIARDDPRWASTVDFVASSLKRGPTVHRYLIDDGLPGDEGGMHICTGWLIESLLTLSRFDQAKVLLDQVAALVTGPGILSEQFDPRTSMAVGNLAQAYSHLALINAAVAMDAYHAAHSAPARAQGALT